MAFKYMKRYLTPNSPNEWDSSSAVLILSVFCHEYS